MRNTTEKEKIHKRLQVGFFAGDWLESGTQYEIVIIDRWDKNHAQNKNLGAPGMSPGEGGNSTSPIFIFLPSNKENFKKNSKPVG